MNYIEINNHRIRRPAFLGVRERIRSIPLDHGLITVSELKGVAKSLKHDHRIKHTDALFLVAFFYGHNAWASLMAQATLAGNGEQYVNVKFFSRAKYLRSDDEVMPSEPQPA